MKDSYRAYNKDGKNMYYNVGIDCFLNVFIDNQWFDGDFYQIMQCIGKKDVNKVMVYEKDYLLDGDNDILIVEYNYDDCEFNCLALTGIMKGTHFYFSSLEDIQVIGNKYENNFSELLLKYKTEDCDEKLP